MLINKNMPKNNIIILSLCFILISVSICFFYFSKTADSYYAVYLKTGDLYFGHLSTFPSLVMTDVYYMQQNQTDKTVGLQKFADSVFNPENKLTISRDNIVWTTKLKDDSQVIKLIKQGVTAPSAQTQTKVENNNQVK
jgi:hypothetical protein